MTIIETKEWIRQSVLEEVIVVKGNVLRISIIGNSICRDIHGRKNLWVVSPAPLLSLSSARLSPGETKTSIDDDSVFGAEQV
jgi:hypothetical protein